MALEPFAADVALEWRLAGVDARVLNQLGRREKALGTVCAVKVARRKVALPVVLEAGRLSEPLAAIDAFVRIVVGVAGQVLDQHVFLLEGPVTLVARVFANRVHTEHLALVLGLTVVESEKVGFVDPLAVLQ